MKLQTKEDLPIILEPGWLIGEVISVSKTFNSIWRTKVKCKIETKEYILFGWIKQKLKIGSTITINVIKTTTNDGNDIIERNSFHRYKILGE